MNVIAPFVESAFLGFSTLANHSHSNSDFLTEKKKLVTPKKLKFRILEINAFQAALTYLAIGRIEKILQFKGYSLGPFQYIAPLAPFFLSRSIEKILSEKEEKKQEVPETRELKSKKEERAKRRLYTQEQIANLRTTVKEKKRDETLKREIPAKIEDLNSKQKYLHRACEIAIAVSSLALLYFCKWAEGAIPLSFLAVYYLLEYKIIPFVPRIMISRAMPKILLYSGGAHCAIRLYQ